MNNVAEVCLAGLDVKKTMQSAFSYYITYICPVTLQALSETIHPIWFNVKLD